LLSLGTLNPPTVAVLFKGSQNSHSRTVVKFVLDARTYEIVTANGSVVVLLAICCFTANNSWNQRLFSRLFCRFRPAKFRIAAAPGWKARCFYLEEQ
jgi:hypothetical protein